MAAVLVQKLWQLCWLIQLWWQLGRVAVLAAIAVVAAEKVVAAVAVVASSTSCELSFLWHYLHSNLFGEAVLFFCPLKN